MPSKREAESISSSSFPPRKHLITSSTETLRLRYSLAEDGCKESQVALAKSFLKVSENNAEEYAFYSQLAIYWLLKAANSGQEEAFCLLKDFAHTSAANSTRNSEIEQFLRLTESQKISRRVSYSIFHAIMSDTEEAIPENFFREKIEALLGDTEKGKDQDISAHSIRHVLKKTDESNNTEEKTISFGDLVQSIHSCLENNVPLLSLKQLSYPTYNGNLSIVRYFYWIWDLTLMSTENFVRYFSSLLLPFTILFMYIFIHAINLIFPGNPLHSFSMKHMLSFVLVFCFISMLSLTCFVIYIKFGNENMKRWLNLITIFEPNMNSKNVNEKYLMKTCFPLIAFLLIFIVYITLVPLVPYENKFTDIGILSLLLMFLVDKTITQQRYNIKISLIINSLTCLSKANILSDVSSVWNIPNWNISYSLGNNVLLCFSFLSCLALPFVLPFLYIKMAFGNERKGWFLVLLPHWMSLIWMNLACQHFTIPSKFLFPSLYASYYTSPSIAFPFYLYTHFDLSDFEVELYLLLLFTVCVYIAKKLKITNENKFWPSLICIAVFASSYHALSNSSTPELPVLPWEKYQAHCLPNSWYRNHPTVMQMACLPLKGRDMILSGKITSIHVSKVNNRIQTLLNVLPESSRYQIIRTFGKCYSSCDEGLQWERNQCQLHKEFNLDLCHFHNWNEYDYKINLELSTRSSPEIILSANHACTTLMQNLQEGDSLQVIATLDSNIGLSSPTFILRQAHCTSCYSDVKCDNLVAHSSMVLNYELSLQNVIWFLFYPLLQYKTA